MTLSPKSLAVLISLCLVPVAMAAPQQGALRPSGHFCIDQRLSDGRTVPVCRCYSAIDCRRVVPACTVALLASDPNAERTGRCARRVSQR